MKILRKIRWSKLIKFIIVLAVLGVGGYFGYQHFFGNKGVQSSAQTVATTQKVETKTIKNVLSGSGTIQPLNTYDVTTLVQGEVISADFEEGDTVEKGQVLYQISTDDVDSSIENAQTSVTRAEENVTKAEESYSKAVDKLAEAKQTYEEAKEDLGDNKVESDETGIVKSVSVKEGDTIQSGAQIAEIYDNSYMILTIPFSSSDADDSLVGKTAKITVTDSFESINGTVTKVSSIDEALSGNKLVKEVTIKVKNPGGITETTTATATIGSLSSSAEGTFAVLTNAVIASDKSGEIEKLNISEGDSISEGDIVLTITQESIDDQLENYKNAIETAEDSVESAKDNIETAKQSLEDAESNLDDVIDSKADYSITAPISGQVISKDVLVGDTIKSTDMNSTLCTIYDLSAVTFSMYVDELDIGEVSVDQEVSITADALEGVEITGKVTNISLVSNASSGVTQYPVTVKIDDVGDLLPGMNVTGNIIIAESENCLAVPSDAVMRGNTVYVKDDSVTEANGDVPAGFKAVTVETGLTDGDYVEITSGLTGSEEVYVARAISTEAATAEESLLDGLGLTGGSDMGGGMPSGGSGGMPSGGGGNFGGGMPSGGQ